LSTASAPLSNLHRGTAFEKRSLKLLQNNLSMTLQRVGGKEDGGIDLLGWWWLPDASRDTSGEPLCLGTKDELGPRRRIRVIAQCKAEKKKIGPKYVRELEGVLLRYSAMSSSPTSVNSSAEQQPILVSDTPEDIVAPPRFPLVALFISESPFTQSALLRAYSSPVPFFLLHIPPFPEAQNEVSPDLQKTDIPEMYSNGENIGFIGSAIWNPALAGARGILGGEMEIRWERSLDGDCGRPGIWWRNARLQNWAPGA
ncbi:hypothetical protein AMATHDRAFT_102731, partial [Amanita thiersii Skay4041]